MASTEVQPRIPMYRVQPYFKIKKIKLPDCMYLLHPIHSPAYWKALEDGGEISLDNIEKRQDDLLQELQKLNDKVTQLSEKLGVDPASLLEQPPTVADIAISCPVSQSPAILLALYRHVSQLVPTSCHYFKHSSARKYNLINCFEREKNLAVVPNPQLKITLIWKSESCCPNFSMMVSPHDQVPIEGMANIARYICRMYCPDLYEDLGPEIASMIDSWLDRLYHTFLVGNARERASVVRNLNASIATNTWLVGNQFSLADIVLYCVISQNSTGLKLIGTNIEKWMKNCRQHPLLANIPVCEILHTHLQPEDPKERANIANYNKFNSKNYIFM